MYQDYVVGAEELNQEALTRALESFELSDGSEKTSDHLDAFALGWTAARSYCESQFQEIDFQSIEVGDVISVEFNDHTITAVASKLAEKMWHTADGKPIVGMYDSARILYHGRAKMPNSVTVIANVGVADDSRDYLYGFRQGTSDLWTLFDGAYTTSVESHEILRYTPAEVVGKR